MTRAGGQTFGTVATLALSLAASAGAQARVTADPMPPHAQESRYAGARLMRSGVASQFDSLGTAPLGHVGDSVTAYLFTYNDVLTRVVHARITGRQRFQPPVSWRAACDEIAHPGWFFQLSPASTALFAVVVPGTFGRPVNQLPSLTARNGAMQFFHDIADSAWLRYVAYRKPADDRSREYMRADFWGPNGDARYGQLRMFGLKGTEGRTYTAFSFAVRDDRPDAPNTTRTMVVDAWGFPVATALGNLDLYGTVRDGDTDAVLTSSGLIRWDGKQWRIPPVYSEEPCLYHRTMPIPAGARP
jgi:hypothetical protein